MNVIMHYTSDVGSRGTLPSLVRSEAVVEYDNLDTVGGRVNSIELEYKSDASGKDGYDLLDKFDLSPVELLTPSSSKSLSGSIGSFIFSIGSVFLIGLIFILPLTADVFGVFFHPIGWILLPAVDWFTNVLLMIIGLT